MDDQPQIRFEEVYRATYEQILGYVSRRCPSPEDAADVVAETYTVAWRRVTEIPPGDQARLWLYGVARRTLANHARGERRRALHLAQLRAQTDRLFAAHAEGDTGSRGVREAFEQLSDDDREVLSLAHWEGLDPGGIAAVLGCSRNAVRIRMHRARKRFARALEDASAPRQMPIIREESH